MVVPSPFFLSKMPRKKLEKPRKQIGVYIEEELLTRFHNNYENKKAPFGEFTSVLNTILRTYLNELDYTSKLNLLCDQIGDN